jgi:hypothetical protein
MKAYKGDSCITPHILNFGTRWSSVIKFMPGPLYPGERNPVCCIQIQALDLEPLLSLFLFVFVLHCTIGIREPRPGAPRRLPGLFPQPRDAQEKAPLNMTFVRHRGSYWTSLYMHLACVTDPSSPLFPIE